MQKTSENLVQYMNTLTCVFVTHRIHGYTQAGMGNT